LWNADQRQRRRHELGEPDQRGPFQRDHDRVLFSSAFKRLSGVTQIVRANEADGFHNRLSHTLKVAQLGRRLAEKLVKDHASEAAELGIDPDVVTTACLVHDLGHPPFGHLGEEALDTLVAAAGDQDGFEGNAQSFRVVTKLAVRFEEEPGLDLTRAALAASMKYPWLRDKSDPDKSSKWGAYRIDADDFDFARSEHRYPGRTAEAAIMDMADDIAYSVHDMEDMHRAQLIPWSAVASPAGRNALVEAAQKRWHKPPSDSGGRLRAAHSRIMELLKQITPDIPTDPYDGRKEHRRQIRFLTSYLIDRYVRNTSLRPADRDPLYLPDDMHDEIRVLKQLARSYLIMNPTLGAQQHGQRLVLQSIFEALMSSDKIVPVKFKEHFALEARPRAVADLISSLTETEALAFRDRLQGQNAGSIRDPIIW